MDSFQLSAPLHADPVSQWVSGRRSAVYPETMEPGQTSQLDSLTSPFGMRIGKNAERVPIFLTAAMACQVGAIALWAVLSSLETSRGQEDHRVHVTETAISRSVRPYVMNDFTLEMAASPDLESVLVWNGEQPMFNMIPIPLPPGFFKGLGQFAFAPGGEGVIFSVKYGSKVMVYVIEGRTLSSPLGPFAEVSDLAFKEDGNSFQFTAKDTKGRESLWVDGVETPPGTHPRNPQKASAADVQRKAAVEKLPSGKQAVSIDGIRGEAYAAIHELVFSPGNAAVAYIASRPFTAPPSETTPPGGLRRIYFGNEQEWFAVVNGAVRHTWMSGGPVMLGARGGGLSHLVVNDSGSHCAFLKTNGNTSRMEIAGNDLQMSDLWAVQNFVPGGEPRFVSDSEIQFMAVKQDDPEIPTPVYLVSIKLPAGPEASKPEPSRTPPSAKLPKEAKGNSGGDKPHEIPASKAALPKETAVPGNVPESIIQIQSPRNNSRMPAKMSALPLRFQVVENTANKTTAPSMAVEIRSPQGTIRRTGVKSPFLVPLPHAGTYRVTLSGEGLSPVSVTFRKESPRSTPVWPILVLLGVGGLIAIGIRARG